MAWVGWCVSEHGDMGQRLCEGSAATAAPTLDRRDRKQGTPPPHPRARLQVDLAARRVVHVALALVVGQRGALDDHVAGEGSKQEQQQRQEEMGRVSFWPGAQVLLSAATGPESQQQQR